MINFGGNCVYALRTVPIEALRKDVEVFLIEDEELLGCFKSLRDKVVITNKRVIVIDYQGVTGKKTDYTSLPFSKVQAFSIETKGNFDLDSEIELAFTGLGKVKFEIVGEFDIIRFNRILSNQVLK